ncbi:MAG: hypothetical protein ACR2HN_12020 [Tepidiformaceae bacterium]
MLAEDAEDARRLVVLPAVASEGLRGELAAVRAEARARVTETDLLVAALRDHIGDLRAERDRLLVELQGLRAERQLAAAGWWLARGTKHQR